MRTFEQYLEKLKTMRPNVYMDGGIVARDDARFMPGIRTIGKTFDMAADPEHSELTTAVSHLTGEKINRYTHIHQSQDDLLKKQKMTRMYCRQAGRCIQRCMGIDALNGISVVTKDMDNALGTEYHQRFLKYMEYYQKNDLVGNAAQTDVKGDRSLRAFQQEDPDMYLRIVERQKDGIIVRGAKAHNTIAPYADEIIAFPTRAMTTKDSDWAVAFAMPADTEGMYLVSVAHNQREKEELPSPFAETGTAHSITIFDNVFVPWERVFMCGEDKFAGQMASLFALYHRHSYTGCKPALTDILMGAAALVSEYNGLEKASHVRDKLADMVTVAELVYATGIAASVTSKCSASGTYVPEVVYTNVGRYHAGVNVYHEFEILADLAGGLAATLPHEKDFFEPTVGPLLNKYIKRKSGVSSEDIHRCYRLIEGLICSAPGAASQVSGIHGGGSPIMEKIAIMAQYDLSKNKELAKFLAGIKS
ncbi:MAG: aromatic ring hydroxylase [Dethiobacter sp.]|nr:aromatic ring hydroxylase [Dethiobacter sp.]